MSLILSAANVIVCILGAATATNAIDGADSALSGASSLNELFKRLTGKAPALGVRIERDISAQMAAQHLSDVQRLLVPQMIAAAPLTPTEVMACTRNPARICDAMLAKLIDPAHNTLSAQDAFRRVVAPILTALLGDTEVSETLRPAFETAVAESLAYIAQQVEALTAQVRDAFQRAAIAEFVVRELARRYAPGSDGDFEQARLGLENALRAYQTMRAQDALPHSATDQVDAVLTDVQRLSDAAEFDRAAEALATAKAEARKGIAEETSGLIRLLDSSVVQATLQNRPEEAAKALVERQMLDAPPDPYYALGALHHEWFVRGRDKGLAFDLAVSIALAWAIKNQARTQDQRGAAMNNLANALGTLGEREAGTARLEEAVAAYREALKVRTRDRVPLDWAATQNNLGNALKILGEREAGTARLEEAVAALRAALEEWTRDRAPLKWAMTQNNLGNALRILGEREAGTARLEEAVASYRAALEEWTRDRVPLKWATTQTNLGSALQTLGEREAGTARLEDAVASYQAALEEWTRDRVPLNWAMAQNNLGNALRILGKREAGTARLEEAVAALRAALEECTRDRVPLEWATAQNNLGNALSILGEREAGTARLEEAVASYRAALEEWTRDRVPLNWAMAQNNLGNALKTLGEREAGTTRLEEAVAALRAALEEWTRDRVPLNWAFTQGNLATVELAFFDKTGDRSRLATARVLVLAARGVFVSAGAEHFVGMADQQLAAIDQRV